MTTAKELLEEQIREYKNALHWIETNPNAPKHYTAAGNEINRDTIRKLLQREIERGEEI